jgi:hypothetical protein
MLTFEPLPDYFIEELIKRKNNHPCASSVDIVENMLPRLIGKRKSIDEFLIMNI